MALKVLSHNQYTGKLIDPNSLTAAPLALYRQWYKEAVEHPCAEPESVALSTATKSAVPSVRFVLLKEVDDRGFVIYTNYESRKGKELEENPYAALAVYWKEQHRSIRAVGRVERLSHEQSQAYYASRPLGSRIGAWASPQSRTIPDRKTLDERVEAIEKRFGISHDVVKQGEEGPGGESETPDRAIEAPPFWGGIRLVPDEVHLPSLTTITPFININQVEFWAGQPSRLHDRFVYRRTSPPEQPGEGTWKIERLAP